MKKYILALTLLAGVTAAKAQLNPFGATYYQNQYLVNPALAGMNKGLTVGLGYRSQWSQVPGAPTTQALTAEYSPGKNAAFGINLNNDAAGLIHRTRALASYAYHLPLNAEGTKRVNFGVSLGMLNERIENGDINGDRGDLSVARYARRDTYIDGDFGIAYTDKRFTMQVAVPNLKNLVGRDDRNLGADRAVFMAALAYRAPLHHELEGFTMEPKVTFRGVHGFHNIYDLGMACWAPGDKVMVQGIYHSSNSATVGLAINHWPKVSVIGIYTTATSQLSSYVNGNFELGIKVKAF